jgi:hypothetical protein
MLVQGRVPTAQEAIDYFKRMAEGKLPPRMGKKGQRTSTLTGSWGGRTIPYRRKNTLTGSWGIRNTPYPNVNLVTPAAMNEKQAEAKLERIGQGVTKRKRPSSRKSKKKRKTIKGKGKTIKGKKSVKKGRLHGTGLRKRMKNEIAKKRSDQLKGTGLRNQMKRNMEHSTSNC